MGHLPKWRPRRSSQTWAGARCARSDVRVPASGCHQALRPSPHQRARCPGASNGLTAAPGLCHGPPALPLSIATPTCPHRPPRPIDLRRPAGYDLARRRYGRRKRSRAYNRTLDHALAMTPALVKMPSCSDYDYISQIIPFRGVAGKNMRVSPI